MGGRSVMFWGKRTDVAEKRGFLMKLLRDVRGNALVIMAAALVPLAGMVGGGIDVSRMYILKTRLQHACDAGSLAGRKAMGGGTWSFNSYYPRTQANLFFDGNFDTGSFGSSDLSRVFTENAGKVTGTVSATIPMTLMKIFGRTTETISVSCSSEMRLPNTDVMFVLDTTGSMADPQPGDSVSKMSALKTSVKCFYEIVARLNTNANCTTGTASGGTGDQVQIRFGFVPYATNANVGHLLKPEWFANSWDYQTRKANTTTTSGWVQTSSAVQSNNNIAQTGVPQSSCNNQAAQDAGYNTQTGYTTNGNNRWYDKTMTNVTGYNSNGATCYGTQTRTRFFETYQTTQVFQNWNYDKLPVTVSLLKNGSTWNDSFQWPIAANGTNKTINWEGCIEERHTTKATSYYPIPSDADDLDLDTVPSAGDANSLWGMVLPDVIHTRAKYRDSGGNIRGSYSKAAVNNTTADYINDSIYACPVEAKKLQRWPDADAFDDYVDSLAPSGNTYHDIGLIWGARLSSPTGLFSAENDYTDKGGEIERHIIFMTDGDACTADNNYTAYGVAWFDRRQTNDSVVPSDGCTFNSATLTEQVNKRTEALCSAIKNKTFLGRPAYTLWVIAFGDLATETETRLQTCATSGRYFKATSAAQLQSTFKSIADQISMLRLTQ
jgi:hypothetical protein